MNFYSKDIINDIIDNMEIDEIIDRIDEFYLRSEILIMKYSYTTISPYYVHNLLKDRTNQIVFRCMDHVFEMDNCPSIMIYNSYYNKQTNEQIYYILFICTKIKYKGSGYASQLLDDFIQKIRATNQANGSNKTCKIVLSSVWDAATFYESYGFKWARDDTILNHKILLKNEKYEDDKEYIMMELVL